MREPFGNQIQINHKPMVGLGFRMGGRERVREGKGRERREERREREKKGGRVEGGRGKERREG